MSALSFACWLKRGPKIPACLCSLTRLWRSPAPSPTGKAASTYTPLVTLACGNMERNSKRVEDKINFYPTWFHSLLSWCSRTLGTFCSEKASHVIFKYRVCRLFAVKPRNDGADLLVCMACLRSTVESLSPVFFTLAARKNPTLMLVPLTPSHMILCGYFCEWPEPYKVRERISQVGCRPGRA